MGKLHELLAVKKDLQNQAAKIFQDLKTTFNNQRHLFEKTLTTFLSNKEGSELVAEGIQGTISTTVPAQLRLALRSAVKTMDNLYGIAYANTFAQDDIVLEDGTVLGTEISATALLELEGELTQWRGLLAEIPTLDPAKGFKPDVQEGEGYFKAEPVVTQRHELSKEWKVIVPATDKFPANIQQVEERIATGTITKREWSVMLTPATKTDLLARCDMMIRSVKRARARANEAEVSPNIVIGQKLADYLLAPLDAVNVT